MRKILFTFGLIIFAISTWAQNPDEKKLERALFDLPNVSFTKVSKTNDTFLQYMLKIKQPLDHNDISKGFIYQRVILTHHGFTNPTMMQTQGYELYFGKNELETALNANHLNIEHRFFGESVPDSMQWKYLNLEQVTADLHYINELFRKIYKGKWISTGISKGGQTTIFYKYFYPHDVNVAIPYVAPFNHSIEDKRIYQFLDTMGSPETRKKIFDLQKILLQNEDKALEKLKWYAKGSHLTFHYLDNSIAKAYELAILEFPFSFWQWGNKIEDIPVKQSLDSTLNYLLKVSSIDFLSDASMKLYAPHYYQAATQMGYYGYNIAPFKNYIKQFKTNPLASYYPKEVGNIVYDNSLNEKVATWLNDNGNNLIYIYGGNDTWSADRVTPSDKVNSKAFIIPGKSHGTARIKNMDTKMQNEIKQLITEWTGLTVDFSK